MRGDFTPPAVVGDVDKRPDEYARGVGSANGARRAVPAAKASGRYRFGEGTFPRIPDNDGEAVFASSNRTKTIEAVRKLLNLAPPVDAKTSQTDPLAHPCPCCGGRMIIIETFEAGCQPRRQPTAPLVTIRIDTS